MFDQLKWLSRPDSFLIVSTKYLLAKGGSTKRHATAWNLIRQKRLIISYNLTHVLALLVYIEATKHCNFNYIKDPLTNLTWALYYKTFTAIIYGFS
jgi:hypothetical protein